MQKGIDINKQAEKDYNDGTINKGYTAVHIACEKVIF